MTIIKDGTGTVVLNTPDYNDDMANHFSASATLDFASIPAQTAAEKTITVTGAVVGSSATATPNGAPEAGLVWSAYVNAKDTVTVRVVNATAAAIDPASRSWRADVWL